MILWLLNLSESTTDQIPCQPISDLYFLYKVLQEQNKTRWKQFKQSSFFRIVKIAENFL